MLVDERSSNPPEASSHTPNLHAHYSPTPTAGSVGDVQAYWTGLVHDNSEYNTEYEEVGGEGDADQGGDNSEIGIDEEIAQLT
ncbi:hypothetical protein NM688_g6680 [Phlebia brevispora]|uniref:Uncharacterized protein n=1 Tax=Phlebia brevispora TaxID=194682 RepID=A0ACC1SDM9_9APHY|nr:hypothetical protein NM688_g6680 [Phlebia brevispora]